MHPTWQFRVGQLVIIIAGFVLGRDRQCLWPPMRERSSE